MGFTRSTDVLRYQADFENERRWLSLDLLSGSVSKRHPLYRYLIEAGATSRELAYFEEHPCPADVIGINYYVTSERFLDSRVELYPSEMIGGNGRQAYVDVEAVRVCADGLVGIEAILGEAYRRYRRPVVVTEAHIGCTHAQQASWLSYVWNSALRAREDGADVKAVTAWALLGAYGWDRLVTAAGGTYEAGAFRVVEDAIEPTEFASFIQQLAKGELPDTEPGWWTRPERLLYPAYERASRAA
jgi:dTDP-4-dehydrorhamnose reductase